jgi:hypothetical protein
MVLSHLLPEAPEAGATHAAPQDALDASNLR